MMDAVVQFLRNALCTAKNFNFLGDTFLYDPTVTAAYYDLPPPLNKTTPLEVLISVTQFYAFVSVTIAGYRLLTDGGVWKLRRITRLVKSRSNDTDLAGKKDAKTKDDAFATAAVRLVNRSLLVESDAATRGAFCGFNLIPIGLAFFWLFANSFHVTEAGWIGGLWGLIHALTVMEVALVVFLYYMVKDAGGAMRTSRKMNEFADTMSKKGKLSDEDVRRLTVEEYGWLAGGWSPFWAEGGSTSEAAEGKMLTKEEEAVASKLASLSKKVDAEVVDDLRRKARRTLLEGYREWVYLLLNALAFYGYAACIVTVYYEEEESQPEWVRAMLLWMKNADADWLGNAVGDFAWTVEPVVILASPMVLNSMTAKRKEKAA